MTQLDGIKKPCNIYTANHLDVFSSARAGPFLAIVIDEVSHTSDKSTKTKV